MSNLTHSIYIENLEKLSPDRNTILFWKNEHSVYQGLDSKGTAIAGCKVLGEIDHELPWSELADDLIVADTTARNGELVETLELTKMATGVKVPLYSRKMPLIDRAGKSHGVVGLSTQIIYTEFIEIVHLLNLSLPRNSNHPVHFFIKSSAHAYLTPKESECLFFLLRGKSAKEIAYFLNLSPRTVETHIVHIKNKCNIRTKEDLFDLAIKYSLISVIPKSLINIKLAKMLKHT